MKQDDGGGPAFPFNDALGEHGVTCSGMSLRDWFAGQLLCGVRHVGTSDVNDVMLAQRAYEIADAMLAERAK